MTYIRRYGYEDEEGNELEEFREHIKIMNDKTKAISEKYKRWWDKDKKTWKKDFKGHGNT